MQWHSLTWKLWKHLLYPQENAVFKRVVTQHRQHKLTFYHLSALLLVGGVISYSLISYLRPLSLPFPIAALVVLAIFSSIFVVMWMVTIAANIIYEHQQATYDLICVSPLGKMGANWAIATGTLHRQDLFRWVETGRRWLSGAILLILLSILVPIILATVGDGRNRSIEGVLLFLDVFVFVILTYVEYIQSVLLGVLIAVLMPRFMRRMGNVTVWAIAVFITLQVIMMIVFLVGGIFIQFAFRVNYWQYPTILPQLVLLYIMREVCIYTLWKLLSHQLSAKVYDLNPV